MLHSRVWDRGSRDSHTSQSKLGRTSSVDQRLAQRLRWLSITPLELPVVPEV